MLQTQCQVCNTSSSNCATYSFQELVISRDVKTVYFFGTGNQFAETGFLPVTERPIVSGIIVTGRSALAISRSLVASRRPVARIPDALGRRETKDSGVSKR